MADCSGVTALDDRAKHSEQPQNDDDGDDKDDEVHEPRKRCRHWFFSFWSILGDNESAGQLLIQPPAWHSVLGAPNARRVYPQTD
jgi:hypothetical protein